MMTDRIEVVMRCPTVLLGVVVQHQQEEDVIIQIGQMKIKTQD
jgi:hypothetical protein